MFLPLLVAVVIAGPSAAEPSATLTAPADDTIRSGNVAVSAMIAPGAGEIIANEFFKFKDHSESTWQSMSLNYDAGSGTASGTWNSLDVADGAYTAYVDVQWAHPGTGGGGWTSSDAHTVGVRNTALPPAVAVTISADDSQMEPDGTVFLTAQVTDADTGAAIGGVRVDWATSAGSMQAASDVTDATGSAESWLLCAGTGQATITAVARDGSGGQLAQAQYAITVGSGLGAKKIWFTHPFAPRWPASARISRPTGTTIKWVPVRGRTSINAADVPPGPGKFVVTCDRLDVASGTQRQLPVGAGGTTFEVHWPKGDWPAASLNNIWSGGVLLLNDPTTTFAWDIRRNDTPNRYLLTVRIYWEADGPPPSRTHLSPPSPRTHRAYLK